jgi:hypothetical protein
MKDDLQMIRDLLPAQPPPTREVTAAARARLLATAPAGHAARGARRRWRPYWLGLPLVAGAAAAGVLFATAGSPVSPQRPGPAASGGAPGITAKPSRTSAPPVPSAHALLLTAATSAGRATPAAQGTYWRVQTQTTQLRLAGSAASPYDMAWMTETDEANARAASKPSRWGGRQLGAKPATPQDEAAWQADGSPHDWLIPYVPSDNEGWNAAKTSSAPRAATVGDMQLHGQVAYAVGDGSWLTVAQLAAFPADPAKLKGVMIKYVNYDYRYVGGPPKGTMDQNLMDEAVNLLQAPLTPAVKSAVYQVMAGLPGSRTLGLTRDPLGRSGYGIAIADTKMVEFAHLPPSTQGQAALIVDPTSGELLATEVVVTTPGTAVVHGHIGISTGSTGRCFVPYTGVLPKKCVLPVYYGPRHQGQVWWYTAIKSASWTNTAP